MANEQNLIPQAHVLTVEDQSKGGKAGAEARRRKRDIRLALEALLEKEYTDKHGNTLSGAEAIALKQMEKALKGDSKAFEIVRDTTGQKPSEKLEVTGIAEQQSKVDELLNELHEGRD